MARIGADIDYAPLSRIPKARSAPNLGQSEHLNAALIRSARPDRRLHARRDGDQLPPARAVAHDAAADRLAAVELPEHGARLRVERAQPTFEIGTEDEAPRGRRHCGDNGGRRSKLPFHGARVGIESEMKLAPSPPGRLPQLTRRP